MSTRSNPRLSAPSTLAPYDYHMPDSTVLAIARLIARAQVARTYMPENENRRLLDASIREVLGVVVPEPIAGALR